MNDFASAKLRRPFLAWLKQEAARRGVPMYDLVEELVARGGRRAWGVVVADGAQVKVTARRK